MQKIIKADNVVTVILSNGNIIESEVKSKEDFTKIVGAKTDEEVIEVLCPDYAEKMETRNKVLSIVEKLRQSKILRVTNNVIYWDNVSSLSVPQDLAEAIVDAEVTHNDLKLTTYRNFWTLMSLNPNEECRKNLFWFLQRYGMTIAKCGFFVGYRNVSTTNKEDVYTDYHSRTTVIKKGEMVTMARSKCDPVQEHTCSSGLHIGGKGWLKKNYFGNVGFACLVNPADVVAVPPLDDYGKLRTCAYLPMETINYDENDNVIPLNVEDGFDCSYVTKVIYEGIMGTEKDSTYKINIPELPGTSSESIQDKLLEIAKNCIVNREL